MRPRSLVSAQRPRRLAALVFCIGASITALLSLWQSRRNEAIAEQAFAEVAKRTAEHVRGRLSMYAYGLRGARGTVISAGIDQINRQRFREYSESRAIEEEFPGARGMGIIRRVREADLPRFIARARRDGAPDFTVRMLSAHTGDHYVIEYVEPIEKNAAAVGLDIASEPNRRTAAQRSARSGKPTLTAPITLVQATGKPLRSFLLLLPIYTPAAQFATPDERADLVVAWAYAPLVVDDVLAGLELGDQFSLALTDTGAPEKSAFFSTRDHDRPPALGLRKLVPIAIHGRTWEAELRASPKFVAGLNLLAPGLVGTIGLALASLLSVLSFSYALNQQRKEQFRAEQARRAAIVDSSNDAIIGETLDGTVTDWNRGAEILFGYSSDEAVGKPAASLILPAERADEDSELRLAIARGDAVPIFDSTRRRADGTMVEVSITVAAIETHDGGRVGFSKNIRDVSAARRATREIAALNASLERQVEERTALLQATQHDLRNILDAVPSLVSYWDRSFRNRFANRAYREWLGWDPDVMPGKALQEIAGEAYASAIPRMEAALRGESVTFETTVPTRDGGVRDAVAHYLPDVVGGEVQGFYVIVYDVTAQTRAKAQLAAALRDNEALLRAINEHAIVSVTDRDGTIVDVNEGFCNISGYTREELLGRDHRLINSGAHEPAFWQQAWRTIEAGKPWRGEVCNRRKDGSLYWVDSVLAPFVGADGRIEKYISIRFDITEAKLNEQKLQQTKDRIAMAADAAGIGIWEWNIGENVLTWDDWMYRLYGRPSTAGHEPYTLWSSSLHPEDRARAERELKDALAGERPFDTEFRIFRGDGQLRHLKASARVLRDESGTPLRMTGLNFDITERKRAELDLLETSSLLKSVLESASEVAIIAADADLTIRIFNPGAERLLGYSADEVVQKTPLLFHDPTEIAARSLELSTSSGEPVDEAGVFTHPLALRQPRDWTYIRKDGARVTVSLVVTAMHGSDGRLFGYLGVAHDVTRQKQYESTLRRAMLEAEQASRAKSQFLANTSHEIRTPMNAVVGLCYLLTQTRLDADQAGLLSKIQIASNSLLALLNDVLDVSKIEAGELELERSTFSLPKLIAEVSELATVQCQAKGLLFRAEVPESLAQRVDGDVTRLAQILNNLISNAIKFTAKGSVTLRVAEESREGSTLGVRFEVEDTGIGLAASVQPRLFAPFAQADASTTRRFGGTGLGLSIVKRLSELMGGQVGLSSEPGQGSTFRVTVPLSLASATASERETEAVRPASAVRGLKRLKAVRVLVADDSDINLFVAKRILQNEGAEVTLVKDGQEAVEYVRRRPTAIDVVLMDAHMPVMDGFGAAEVIRRDLAVTSLPIIALTADARPTERQRAFAVGMDEFLAKPFDPNALIRTIESLVTRSHAQRWRSGNAGSAGAALEWPRFEGIDSDRARELLAGDLELFRELLLRLLEEYTDVSPPGSLEDEPVRAAYKARMHKLKGASGQLGARAISELAGRIELECGKGETQGTRALVSMLSDRLARLREVAKAELEREMAAAPTATSTPATPLLGQIVAMLREQDLAVLGQMQAVYPWARATWDAGCYESFVGHVQSLRFAEAASMLEPHLRSSA